MSRLRIYQLRPHAYPRGPLHPFGTLPDVLAIAYYFKYGKFCHFGPIASTSGTVPNGSERFRTVPGIYVMVNSSFYYCVIKKNLRC